jgi:hypothetical protein
MAGRETMTPSRLAPKQVVTYIPEHLYEILTADADHNKRSISSQLHFIIDRYYAEADTKGKPLPRPAEVHNHT